MPRLKQSLKSFSVERIDDSQIKIEWRYSKIPTPVSIFQSTNINASGRTKIEDRVEGNEIIIKDRQDGSRKYYLLIPEGSKGVWTAERRILMEGMVNFRDMGGYRTDDCKSLKWGTIFRGDSLQRATDTDLKRFGKMNIGKVFDFRRNEEVEKGPNRFPENQPISYHHLPVVHGEFNFMSALERLKRNKMDWIKEETIIKGYIDNTVNFADTWGTVIRQLAKEDCPPLFFHCTAGKDRTGICAALILSALNVPRQTILYDYLLSNPFIQDIWIRVEKMIQKQGVDPKKLEPFFSAPEYAMNSLLNHLERNYGSPVSFLKQSAEVDQDIIDALKNRILE